MSQYTIKLKFDVRQVTQALEYEVVSGCGGTKAYPMDDVGRNAGTFNFQKGDEIFVQVIATAPAGNEEASHMMDDSVFNITNCTFVSIRAHEAANLSLFDDKSACHTVNEWEKAEAINPSSADKKKNCHRYSIMSSEGFTVMSENGQWKISGYLSVQLPPLESNTGSKDLRHQLYFFDPEGSSGNGGLGP